MEIQIGDPYIYSDLYGRIVSKDGGSLIFATPFGTVKQLELNRATMESRKIVNDYDHHMLKLYEDMAKNHPNSTWYGGYINLSIPPVELGPSISKIEFFPDYCADGIWITREGSYCHAAGTIQEVEKKLGVTFPKWFVNKIEAMQRAFDMFAPTHEEDFHSTYGTFSRHMIDFDMLEHIILTDFKSLYPEYAHLVAYSNGNEYNLQTVTFTV
jgi:hypothetical protein